MNLFTDAVRSKKPVPQKYTCPVCARKSQYPGPCSATCRMNATPAQLKPTLIASDGDRWGASP